MTDDEEFDLQEQISEAVHSLVDNMLYGADEESAENIRDRLTETFRFWSR